MVAVKFGRVRGSSYRVKSANNAALRMLFGERIMYDDESKLSLFRAVIHDFSLGLERHELKKSLHKTRL